MNICITLVGRKEKHSSFQHLFILQNQIRTNIMKKLNIFYSLKGIISLVTIMPTKEFRDPVHRFVHVNPYELNIIGSSPFQRLRYIHQLGLTYYVYPGAEHKRFEHSLGTMEIATKLFDILKEKNRDILIKDKTSGEGLFRDGEGLIQNI